MSWLERLLAHPLTRGLDLDDPRTTETRRRVILQKPFLKKIYDEWYRDILERVPDGPGRVLELGSGGGYLRRVFPQLVTSDLMPLSEVSVVADARSLPFRDDSLRAIVMTNVMHHIPNLERFFHGAAGCVRSGGAMVMVEPWSSRWGSWVYRNLHHERFDPEARDWSFPLAGPLSGSNGALAWIVFERDRGRFESEFPEWRLERVIPMMPLRYLVSGGVSMRSLMPGWSYALWARLEGLAEGLLGPGPMFARIELTRTDVRTPEA